MKGAATQQPMSTGVLMHLGKAYAVGLLWFTVQEENGKATLQQRLKKTKADYHCVRKHIAQQQGFGWLEKGHRRGMPVAAAMVADQLVGEWHGIFEADNGWWYLQIRSDTITPQGDRFFTSEEEAYRVFQAEMKAHTWPYAYAPAKWNITEQNVRTLELKDLLDELATTTLIADNVTAIFGGVMQRNLIVGGLITAFIVMGGFAAFTAVKPPEQIIVPPVRTVQKAAPIPALEPPKEDSAEIVSPAQFFAACGKAVSALYAPIPGWTAASFTCTSDRASMSWQQQSGTIEAARTSGAEQWPKDVAIGYNNKLMTVSLKLDQLPKVQQNDMPPQEQALLFLEKNIQALGAVQVTPVNPEPPKPAPAPRGVKALVPQQVAPVPLPYLDVTLTTGFAPDGLPNLANVKGLRLSQIQWTIPKAVWVYQFNLLHARPKTAAPAPVTDATTGEKK